MIDLHCHILPGIDDGPLYVQESIEMAQIAVNDGIQTIVSTPHIKDILHPPDKLRKRVADFNAILQELKIPLSVLLGADVFVLLGQSSLRDYSINNSRYILVEFPHHYLPSNYKQILFNLSLQGLCPIVSHPERNHAIMKNPGHLLDLLHGNILVQVTASSLAGEFGRDIKACAIFLLKKGGVHFLGTDAHGVNQRLPILSAGLKVAEKIIGKEQARKLILDNPEVVLQDKPFLNT